MSIHDKVVQYIDNGNLNAVMSLLNTNNIDKIDYNHAIRRSALFNRLDIIKFLFSFENMNSVDNNGYACQLAVEKGHIEIVKFLINHPKFKPNKEYYLSFILAIEYGQNEIAKTLLEVNSIRNIIKLEYPENYDRYVIKIKMEVF